MLYFGALVEYLRAIIESIWITMKLDQKVLRNRKRTAEDAYVGSYGATSPPSNEQYD